MSIDTPDEVSSLDKGRRVKRLRLMAGLNREQLAKLAKVSNQSVSYWENNTHGGPSKRSAEKVISALAKAGVICSVHWLLTGSGSPPRILTESLTSRPFQESFKESQIETFTKSFPSKLSHTLEKEIELFCSLNENAVITMVEHPGMNSPFEQGDVVGGILEKANDIKEQKLYIVEVNNKLRIGKVTRGSRKGLYNVTCNFDHVAALEPREFSDIAISQVAPVVRIWR